METCRVGNGISIRKMARNRLETVPIILQKKVPILRHSEIHRRVNSKARNGTERNGTEQNYARKISYTK
jgi:hypothetical protein